MNNLWHLETTNSIVYAEEASMKNIVLAIISTVRQTYIDSPIYPITVWDHVQLVAKYAKEFAEKTGANQFVVEVAGLLHDLGAAMYGKDDHHNTGVKEASAVLFKCGCPIELIGLILDCIYSHRGSQKIPLRTQEAKCVAAGDAMEHFGRGLESLWAIQKMGDGFSPMVAYETLSGKLDRDWAKTSPEIKPLLAEHYEEAKRRLFRLYEGAQQAVG